MGRQSQNAMLVVVSVGMRVMATLVATAGLVALSAGPGLAATLTVTTTNDFLTPGDRQCSLREAVAAVDVPPGDGDCGAADATANTIVLGPGQYVLFTAPTGGDDIQTGDLNVSGPTTSLTITGAGPSATSIDARALGDRVLRIGATAPAVTVAQLTITGAHALPGQDGGAIDNAGTLALTGDALTANHAGDGATGVGAGTAAGPGGDGGTGGAVHNTGTLAVTNTTVSDNVGGAGGVGSAGGLNTTPFIAGAGGAGGAGGIANEGGTVTVSASAITGNHAGPGGTGGMGGNIIIGMTANPLPGGTGGTGGGGGGVANDGGALMVVNSTIAGNLAGAGGAGGHTGPGLGLGPAGADGGFGGHGGGILLLAGTANIVQTTISTNAAGAPGAADFGGHDGGAGSGGGFLSFIALGSTIQNSIIAGNLGTDCGGAPAIDAGHDLTGPAVGCPGVRTDPLLGPLQDNGGPTQTMALAAGSPAIDQVPASGAGCPATDQRGIARPQFAACDIGAYELAPPPVTGSPPPDTGSPPPLQLQPPGGPGGVALPTPVLSHLKLTPSRFRAAAKGSPTARSPKKGRRTGTTIAYRDTLAASTTLSIQRHDAGVRIGKSKKCTRLHGKRPKHTKPCTITTTLGHLTEHDRTGSNTLHFSGRLSPRQKLARGGYQLVLSAKSAAGKKSKPLTAKFRITG